MSDIVTLVGGQPAMTSLELVEFINGERGADAAA